MADKQKIAPQGQNKAPDIEKVTEPKKEPYSPKYSILDLVDNAREAFKTDKIIVLAALKKAGKREYTMQEATSIIEKFKKEEVQN